MDGDPFEGLGGPQDDSDSESETQVAIVATQEALDLTVVEVEDDRTPEGMTCMATYIGDRMIARSVISPDVLHDLEYKELFHEPLQLGLAAMEESPGIQGRLFALVPATSLHEPGEESDALEAEPWAASVPRFELEEDEPEVDPDSLVPVLLGHIVRFQQDRKFPGDLPAEAADILRSIISEERPLRNIVDRMLEDLLRDDD